jgi:hypothetical protein
VINKMPDAAKSSMIGATEIERVVSIDR